MSREIRMKDIGVPDAEESDLPGRGVSTVSYEKLITSEEDFVLSFRKFLNFPDQESFNSPREAISAWEKARTEHLQEVARSGSYSAEQQRALLKNDPLLALLKEKPFVKKLKEVFVEVPLHRSENPDSSPRGSRGSLRAPRSWKSS